MRILSVWNNSRSGLLAEHIEVAQTSISRMRGLLGRPKLDAGTGLWIRPSSGVHTVGMRFAIDVIGLDKNLRVVKLWSHLVPYRVTALSWKMHSALELPSGTISNNGVRIGDLLRIMDTSEAITTKARTH